MTLGWVVLGGQLALGSPVWRGTRLRGDNLHCDTGNFAEGQLNANGL